MVKAKDLKSFPVRVAGSNPVNVVLINHTYFDFMIFQSLKCLLLQSTNAILSKVHICFLFLTEIHENTVADIY